MKNILTSSLKPDYYMFGNKGAVWNNKVHIAKSGEFSGTTLCGTPMLSSNHARIEGVKEIGCPTCIKIYNEQNP
jgi:hypothetical protein